MPLAGGASDKFGNRYEGRWTVYCMIDVMDEKAESIRLEEPGENRAEFYLLSKRQRNYHQVKRQNTQGNWPLNKLDKVLSDFWEIVDRSESSCTFISTQDAQELGELAYRARGASSLQEFQEKMLKSQEIEKNFLTLRKQWNNCSEADAYKTLRRIYVKTWGEDPLKDTLENRIAALVEGDPESIRLDLGELAIENIHQELTGNDIWHYLLHERSYRRREWGKDPHVLAEVEKTNELYLSELRKITIAGKTIPRTETEEALKKLTSSEDKNSVLLVGAAGVGKSGVMLQVIEALQQQRMPLIAFRVDRLSPAYHPDKVGEQLKLPASPATVLANIAYERDCVLVIDQLDAVSLASGRHPDFFDCIDRIIQQTQAYPKMRVLLACRKFDLENDNRIKRLVGKEGIAETVSINPLTPDMVKEVVTNYLSLKVSQFTEKQLKLLSIPLHLVLLAELVPSLNIARFDFQTVNDLYDRFWEEKRKSIKQRLNRSVQWTEVIDALCDHMSKKQRLSAPKAILDKWQPDADEMTSEHILLFDGKKYSFFHEDFFDYAFARRFAAQGKNLLDFLRSAEQPLFQRTQVRQILLYDRKEDFEQYLNDLEEIITSEDIRFHIKQVVFSVLATFNEPHEEEWEIIEPLIAQSSDPLTHQIYRMLRGSEGWFILLDSLGAIKNWLGDDKNEELVSQTIFILASIASTHSERVTELLQPYVGVSETWLNHLSIFIQGIQLGKNRSTFDLFLDLIQWGIYDSVTERQNYSHNFWHDIYNLPKQNSDWCCEAIAVYLTKKLKLSIQAGQTNPFDIQPGIFERESFNPTVLIESAENSPSAFANNLLPFMEEVLNLTAYNEGDPPWYDRVWGHRSYQAYQDIDINPLDRCLLYCMEQSLCNLAKNSPDDCQKTLNTLKTSNFETFHYLLIRAYTANGELFADEAIEYLCQNPGQLQTGYDNSEAAHYWATRELIAAVTPHCSDYWLKQLETLLLDYYPLSPKYWQDKRYFLAWRGYAQFVLLDAIAPNRRSPQVKRRWQEWQRKFICVSQMFPGINLVNRLGQIPSPQPMIVGFVGSPVPDKAGDKMSDKQWLQAIADYNNFTSWGERNGQLVGSARELASQLLQPQAKKEPIRFARLVKQFPDDANSMYFDAVLEGIAETDSEIDIETAWMVCQRCDQLPNKPCGRAISRLFSKWPKLSWPNEAFDLLIWYALKHPDPDRELWKTETSNDQYYYSSDVLLAGINSVRGSAVSAIASLIFADSSRANYFQSILDKMVEDPSIAVRACVAEVLIALLNYDQYRAVKLFQQLCNTSDDSLLVTRTVEQFLYYTLENYFDDLKPIVQRMIDSELPDAIAGGTRQICLAAFSLEEARDLAESCLSRTVKHRQAATIIVARNLRLSSCRDFCETALIQLFNDTDANIRSQAAICFSKFEESDLGNYTNLIEHFVKSPAFAANCNSLLLALQKTTAKLPKVTIDVCQSYLERLEPSDLFFRGSTDIVSELVIRFYSQTRNGQLQSQCLDLIDRLTEMNVYGLEKGLQLYENLK